MRERRRPCHRGAMGCATLGCDVRRSSSQAAADRPHAGLTSSRRDVAGGPREKLQAPKLNGGTTDPKIAARG
eukprot:CAMPEP_0177466054 /NCGR_PEP_ID=MMETSP0369-20130122/17754_1 /TAXON_ID=447022 ORGANISM="Scrippsiella hangoei-like, Strain SHHI-4" /NCGR_SAMPLE_ID=MMETSP0369 /ASSEMBLY_ACC=CAM_ASM_000364 /LENGTH=71 /DNA_ID=CAMNT_0018940003 /DNA_START=41 /DNA_END=253 /DNA_ORIENTATION=-